MKKIVRIKEAISADLALRNRADAFFDKIDKLDANEVVIDFSEVRSISRSFAHQYDLRKKASKQKMTEIHLPQHVTKMFKVVESSNKKNNVVDSDSIPLMTI
jgi:anti-anti-sigma regulatory factor